MNDKYDESRRCIDCGDDLTPFDEDYCAECDPDEEDDE